MIDKENHEAGFYFWGISVTFCWKTDVLEILPNVRLWLGYIEGIFDREMGLQISWLVCSLCLTVKTK